MANDMTTSKHKDCNAQESVFVDTYLETLDPRKSAETAKYSATMAKTKAYMWVSDSKTKPHVFNAIQKAMDRRAARTQKSGDDVLEEIGHSAFIDPARYFDKNGHLLAIHDMPEDVRRSISTIKVKREPGEKDADGNQTWDTITELKVNDKTRNLELYGKHLKLFTDKVETTGADGGPIKYTDVTDEEIENKIQALLNETADE